jgi:hypothetical protein
MKTNMVSKIVSSSGIELIRSSDGQRLLLGSEEVLLHDLDREKAWVSLKDGLPLMLTVKLSDLRSESLGENFDEDVTRIRALRD